MDGIAELLLVKNQPIEAIKIAAGTLLDERAPQVDELLGCRRRREPGQALAHHQRHRLLDRRVGSVGDVVELAAMKLVLEHGGEIAGDAMHAPGADCLDTRLLDRIEDGAGLLAAGNEPAVHGGVMTGYFERDRVGMPAHDCRLFRAQPARRLRQARLGAHETGTFGGEGDLEPGMTGDGAQAAGHGALEGLVRRFLGRRLGLDVGGCRHERAKPSDVGRCDVYWRRHPAGNGACSNSAPR